MIYQWLFSRSLLLLILVLFSIKGIGFSQTNCIKAPSSVCLGSCIPVEYVGNNSDFASYNWTISCGTITNPTLKNPHEACFNSTGICTIMLITQEPGSGPETCTVQVNVEPIPTARFVLRTDSVCSGNCLGLRVDLTGKPPFMITYRDTTGNHIVRSGSNSTIISVCPTVSQFIAIINVTDANCVNQGVLDAFRIKVFAPFKAFTYQEHSKLCASPPAFLYRWFECGTNNLVSNNSCFTPPKEDCYCAVVFNGFCYDTACTVFKCNLDCGIEIPDKAYIGDEIVIKYKGNGGPDTKKNWKYTYDHFTILESSDDSLKLKFTYPGCYPIQLKVDEEICTSSCMDSICVLSRPCACSVYNKNLIEKSSSSSGSCCYTMDVEINSESCFSHMKVLTNAGNFTNLFANGSMGLRIGDVSSQSFFIYQRAGQLPLGAYKAADFCVEGASQYTITVYYYFNNNGINDSCKYQYVFDCSLKTPNKCDSVTSFLELVHTNSPSCCYFIRTNNPFANYFNYLTVTVSGATVNTLTPSLGYLIVNSSLNSFTINHNLGFIPSGFITPASFCLNVLNNPVTINLYYIKFGVAKNDTCHYRFLLNCPDDGTPKENCCDSTKATLSKVGTQNCCWDLFSYSKISKCFSKICVTASSGNFTNVVANNGWSVSSIANGICFTPTGNFISTGTVNPGQFCMTGFSNPITFIVNYYDSNGNLVPDCRQVFVKECPIKQCSCEGLDNQIFQTSSNPGICCHSFLGTIPFNSCFTRISVSINAGVLSNIVPSSGYSVVNPGSSGFFLTPNSGFLPSGNITPATFCVSGAQVYSITIQYYYIDQNGFEQRCVFTQMFDCPKEIPKCTCDSLLTQINQISTIAGTCCHNFTSTVTTSNCFTKIGVSTSAGVLGNIQASSGFVISNPGSTSFTITHGSNYIPSGNITPASFCVSGATIYTITVQYFYLDQNGIEQRCIETMLFDCPNIKPLCNCDSLNTQVVPHSINPGLCCYSIASQIHPAQCFTKASVSVSAGSITNIQLASGFNLVNQSSTGFLFSHTSGFIPSGSINPATFCISGASVYTITIQYYYVDNNGIEQRCVKSQTFDCPNVNKPCNCDSLSVNIVQTSNNPGLCCNRIDALIPAASCMIGMSVSVNPGILANVVPSTNYTIGNLTASSFNIGHTSGFLPQGNISPVNFCVTGANVYTILVKFTYVNNGKIDSCVFNRTFECKPADTSAICDQSSCSGSRVWQSIGTTLGNLVYDLKSYKCKLYAAGQFSSINNQAVGNIAYWDGTNWNPIPGGGTNGPIRVLEVHNGLLYVGGRFTLAGSVPVNNLAVWNGSNWADVGGGVTGINPSPTVFALLSTNNGLIVGGQFAQLGNSSIVNNIALWNGSWSAPFANGIPYPIGTLRIYNSDLYAAGAFFSAPYYNIAKWNGISWSPLSPNGITLQNNVTYDGVSSSFIWNNELLIGGNFKNAENIPNTRKITRWNGSNFLSMIEGDIADTTASIRDFIRYDGDLFVGGAFSMIGNTAALGVARSVNSNWNSVNHTGKLVWALETYDSCGAIPCDLYSAGEGFLNRWKCITSVENNNVSSWVKIYPNPARDVLNIKLEVQGDGEFEYRITNITGQELRKVKFLNLTSIQIDIQDIPSGLYQIEVTHKTKGKAQKKFVKM